MLLSDPHRSWVIPQEDLAEATLRLRAATVLIPLALCEQDARAGLRREGKPVPVSSAAIAAAA